MSVDPEPADQRGNTHDNPFDSGLPMIRRPPEDDEPPGDAVPGWLVGASDVTAEPEDRVGTWDDWLEPDTDGLTAAKPHGATTPIRRTPPDQGVDLETPVQRLTLVDRSGPGSGPWRAAVSARSSGKSWWYLLFGVAVVVAFVAMVVATRGDHRPEKSAGSPGSLVPQDISMGNASDGCVQNPGTTPGSVVSGTGPGDTTSGPNAVLAFEYAYYVARDGHRARTLTTSDAAVPDADAIARGIAQIPRGTRYCVWIAPAGPPETLRVDVTQQYPGESPETFPQLVHLTTHDGQTLITKIEPASP